MAVREPGERAGVGGAMRLLLGLLFLFAAAPASAQRPAAFYILTPAAPPEAELARLPEEVRAPYARLSRARSAWSAAAEHRQDGDTRRARLTRLGEELDAAWSALHRALEASRRRLDARGWLLLGEARTQRATSRYLAALDAYERDPDPGADPGHPDLSGAIVALRMASALASDLELGGWARYREAVCLLEMGRASEAEVALRIVAASGPQELRGEARLRLAALATEESEAELAVAWLERAQPDVRRPDLVAIVVYELAWAYFRMGRLEPMRAAIARLPADALPALREDLEQLLTPPP